MIFATAVKKYFSLHQVFLDYRNQQPDQQELISHLNEYILSDLYQYQINELIFDEKTQLPNIFIAELNKEDFVVVDYSYGVFNCITKQKRLEAADLEGKRLIHFTKINQELSAQDLLKVVMKKVPKVGYVSVVLVIFAVLSPLYSNLFNTRLVYSDSFNSILYITGIFIILLGLEIILKNYVYHESAKKIKQNNLLFGDYMTKLLGESKCNEPSIKVRLFENSAIALWESWPLLIVDIALIIVFSLCVIFMLGVYALIPLIYYALFTVVCIHIRFKAYLHTLLNFEYVAERIVNLSTLENFRSALPFVKEGFLSHYIFTKNIKDENNRITMNIENHHWAEFIKANSFISLAIVYFACYFSISNGIMGIGSIIAIMIINSRLSGSLVSMVSRIFSIKTNKYHALNSITTLIKDVVRNHHQKIDIPRVNNIQLDNLGIVIEDKVIIHNYSETFVPGEVIGVIGSSGAGKTTLLNTLAGNYSGYTGKVYISSVAIEDISGNSKSNLFGFYDTSLTFLSGTLRDTFNVFGIKYNKDIIEIIKSVNKSIPITNQLVDVMPASKIPFSNGEKQRLLILMTVFKQPQILFLDEPTSFLGKEDAQQFMQQILSRCKNSIVFVATHDMALTRIFTKNIVLQQYNGANEPQQHVITINTKAVNLS